MQIVSSARTAVAFMLGAATMWLVHTGAHEAQAGRALGVDAFGKALRTVLERHVDPVEPSRALEESLKRIVSGLDRYSHYLTAEERQLLRQRSRGGLTGMVVDFHRAEPRKPASLEVAAVLPGSPAEKIGLAPGDNILKVRGQEVAFMVSQAEVDVLLVGGDGETIDLVVQRRSDPAPIALRLSSARSPVVAPRPARGPTAMG